MFEDSLMESRVGEVSLRKGWTTVVSISLQFAIAGLVIALPLIHPETLPFRIEAPKMLLAAVAEAACAACAGSADHRGCFESCGVCAVPAGGYLDAATGQRRCGDRRAFAPLSRQFGDARWFADWAWRWRRRAASECFGWFRGWFRGSTAQDA